MARMRLIAGIGLVSLMVSALVWYLEPDWHQIDQDASLRLAGLDEDREPGGTANTYLKSGVTKPAVSEPEMVKVDGGCFLMGSPEDELGRDESEDQQQICVDSFWIGRYEVTVGEFRRFVDSTGYLTGIEAYDPNAPSATSHGRCWVIGSDGRPDNSTARNWRAPNVLQRTLNDHPVGCLDVTDLLAYVRWLNKQTGKRYRLPTHAEWEFAARGGNSATSRSAARFWGEQPDVACRYANVLDRSWRPKDPGVDPYRHACSDGHPFVARVGSFEPNALGLYDMLGNVREIAAVTMKGRPCTSVSAHVMPPRFSRAISHPIAEPFSDC